jgi:hypothetical protein
VAKAPLAGGAVTTLASSLDSPTAIALHATNLYWTDGPPFQGRIMTVPIAGGAPSPLATSLSPTPNALAVDGSQAYATTELGTTIVSVPLSGGTLRTLATNQTGPTALLLDGGFLYWVLQGNAFEASGALARMPVSGGTPQILAEGQADPFALTMDSTAIYWVNHSDPGQVMRLAKP